MTDLCIVCDLNYAVKKNRCDTCYRFWRRTGEDRPPELVEKQADLNYRRQFRPGPIERALRRVLDEAY